MTAPETPETPEISVVLPVHAGVDPAHLAAGLDSLRRQERRAEEVVIVEDGPLSAAHRAVLERFEQQHDGVRRVVLAVNSGAGVANQAGLAAARGVWIAKADADDLNRPDRLARQLAHATAHDLDLLGSAMAEFDDDPATPVAIRPAPTGPALARRVRWNNPVNHPTAFYRREAALAAGGYPPWRHMQDYGLMARLLAAGARADSLPDPLVSFRAGPAVLRRRRALGRLEWGLQTELRRLGLISAPRMVLNLLLRRGVQLLPAPVFGALYGRALRRPVDVPRERSRAVALAESLRAVVLGFVLTPWFGVLHRLRRRPVVGEAPVVVSLTTYGSRLRGVHLTLESIAAGTVRPHRLVLWLDDAAAVAAPPRSLRRLQRRGLEVRGCEDLGPHKKYVPALALDPGEPESPLVTADDDVYYPRRWLADLVDAGARAPEALWCHRSRRRIARGEGWAPYREWPLARGTDPSADRVPTGVGGVWYPVGFLAELRAAGDAFRRLAPRADDLWIHHVAVRAGRGIGQVADHPHHFPVRPVWHAPQLATANLAGGNDDVVRALAEAEVGP
ncbi:glycosyltransferase [Nocardioides sp.]|uniref:glycosyltransferase n=1 Tax=Nocardioides sp. TaxID=35761 RepID=UPI00351620C4